MQILIIAFLYLGYFTNDDVYMYDPMFSMNVQDDGSELANYRIKEILLADVCRTADKLVKDSPDSSQLATDTATLVDSMLQLRAFSQQRKSKVSWSPSELKLLATIAASLAPLDLSYRKKEMQALVNLFNDSKNRSQIIEIKKVASTILSSDVSSSNNYK